MRTNWIRGRGVGQLFCALATALLVAPGRVGMSQTAVPPGNQAAEYAAAEPKSITELQQFRNTSRSLIKSGRGAEGTATLVNLNPTVSQWYLLKVAWRGGSESSYHLENPEPHSRNLTLDSKYPFGIQILEGKTQYSCNLYGDDSLEKARNSQLIYASLCENRLFLRNPGKGHRTDLEAATEVFRDRVWGGEQVITVLHHVLADSHRESAEMHNEGPGGSA